MEKSNIRIFLKKAFLIGLIFGLCLSEHADPHSSASYRFSSEDFNASIGSASSASYKTFGEALPFGFNVTNSSSYRIGEGFIHTIFLELAVLVTSITPNNGYNTGSIFISNIGGAGFRPGAQVKLTKSGENDIIASNVNLESDSKITCRFELTGKSTGNWNIVVTNPDGKSGILPSAFTIKTWVPQGQVMNSPNPFNPLKEPTTLIYFLPSNADTAILIFNISQELIYRQDFIAGSMGGRAGDNSISWNGFSAFNELTANGVYFIRVIDRTSGKVLAKGKIAVSK